MSALDPTKFAAAKLNLLLGVGIDADLPKLALRVANVLAGQYMCADNGGEAWPAINRLCCDLGVSSERAVRQALYTLLERGHLIAERKAGGTTRYRIAERYFDASARSTQAHHEPDSRNTPAQNEPGTQADLEPTPQAHHEPGTQAHHEPTNSGNRSPGIEHRELNTGNHSIDRGAEIVTLVRAEEGFSGPRGKQRQLQVPIEIIESTAEPRDFAAFFHVYPKKVGRLEAAEAFREAMKHADASEIIAGAQRYAASRQAAESDPVERERFTASADKWLRGRRWRDEHAAPRPAGVGKHFAAALRELEADLG